MSESDSTALELAEWLSELPHSMHWHEVVLRSLMAEAARDPRLRALQVQGSIGRGEGDALSDLDVGLVAAEDAWPAIAEEIPSLLSRIGTVVDAHYGFLPGIETPEIFKAWVQFTNSVQLDLLLIPTSRVLGSGPDGRTLLDRDGILVATDHPMRLSDPATVADWAFLAWQNLTEVTKYLERGRPAAAAEWLSSARQATISCWAAAHGVEYAGFANVASARLGFTAPWPDGLEHAYPRPEAHSVLSAALALAQVQERADALLARHLAIPPRPLARWARERLELLQSVHSSPGIRPVRSSRPRR